MNTNLHNELSNNILEHTEKINNADNINSMMILKKNICMDISLCRRNIEELQKLINLIDRELMQKCVHDWKRDYSYYGEHSQYTCSICRLCK